MPFENVGDLSITIMGERVIHEERRQMVVVLLIDPTGKRVALSRTGGVALGRSLFAPPCGEVNLAESPAAAARRVVRERLQVGLAERQVVLGSAVRRPKRGQEVRYNWIAGHADNQALARGRWYSFDTLDTMASLHMSDTMSVLFQGALRRLYALTRDRALVRPQVIAEHGAAIF